MGYVVHGSMYPMTHVQAVSVMLEGCTNKLLRAWCDAHCAQTAASSRYSTV